MKADNSELLAEAVPESLKNILLVMSEYGIFKPGAITFGKNIWDLSWTTIDSFCPSLKESILAQLEPVPPIPAPAAGQATSPVPPEATEANGSKPSSPIPVHTAPSSPPKIIPSPSPTVYSSSPVTSPSTSPVASHHTRSTSPVKSPSPVNTSLIMIPPAMSSSPATSSPATSSPIPIPMRQHSPEEVIPLLPHTSPHASDSDAERQLLLHITTPLSPTVRHYASANSIDIFNNTPEQTPTNNNSNSAPLFPSSLFTSSASLLVDDESDPLV